MHKMLAVVFDFDDTLTVKKAKRSKYYDYNAYLKPLFGSDERILMVVRYLRKLKKTDGADLYICSGNSAELITRVIEELHALGFDIHVSQFSAIVGNENEKAKFVNSLRYRTVVFIDNDVENYEGLLETVQTVRIAESGGMYEEDFQSINVLQQQQQQETESPSTPPKRSRLTLSPTRSEFKVW